MSNCNVLERRGRLLSYRYKLWWGKELKEGEKIGKKP